ncbi:MAG: patatin-like phospholipase family protein [Kofleriaceae bacterium]|jgi:NTE family protein|nr:patatin-like phospholipase family protein [Kofleriaceae bacterium]MBP6840654.1 patatin-like phospholipase family protein [Kofleriaceae bacterium]MBP9204568.1 patatin-like phospholipase family protein [Kofleriaceae bacterium]
MTQTLGDWLDDGPFALAMSSGFFAFYAHAGMLAALTERGLRPSAVSGSSAGALIGGAWAAGAEPDELARALLGLRRPDFWDPAPGLGLLAGRRFDAVLRALLPTPTLEACRVPAALSVFDLRTRATRVLTRGDLATAIRASCAVPGMFHPVAVDGRPTWDGGILDRPGTAGLPPGRALLHHIASRSPWRRPGSPALVPPRRRDLTTLVLADLPRSGPFRLDAGRRAFAQARTQTTRALDLPVADVVHA